MCLKIAQRQIAICDELMILLTAMYVVHYLVFCFSVLSTWGTRACGWWYLPSLVPT
ncbi:hypothetical protein GALMADRAFT_1035762 [Galerina marginata CBS 339.88]|uniref:Uncharacterized protein n=1 Tax=Galerina marginata (strain CBS 339.88) TaxID=685588 RepID=A0A067SCF3_GALM3|nr:hypothetical protein GALMADRAFT_1035762 [Galerina marginata CBS 339.88]